MAYSLVVYEEFEGGLDSIVDYHVNRLCAQSAARALLDDLDRAMDATACMPTINAVSTKPLPADQGYLELLVRDYVALYRIEGDSVYVARMFHQTQDFENAFG